MTYQRFNNLNGGSVARLRTMRAYVRQWNENPKHGSTLEGWREARKHGKGSIRISAHGPSFSRCGKYCNIPSDVLDGLRGAGYADETLSYLRHQGYYRDDECGAVYGTYRGQVWQLPARKGETLYLAGIVDADAEYAMLDCGAGKVSLFVDKDDAASAADSLAERMAEDGPEYCEQWQEARDLSYACEELREDLAEIRATVKAQCEVLRCLPALATGARITVQATLQRLCARFKGVLSELIEKRAQLLAHPRCDEV
jgi:hypothetical protein